MHATVLKIFSFYLLATSLISAETSDSLMMDKILKGTKKGSAPSGCFLKDCFYSLNGEHKCIGDWLNATESPNCSSNRSEPPKCSEDDCVKECARRLKNDPSCSHVCGSSTGSDKDQCSKCQRCHHSHGQTRKNNRGNDPSKTGDNGRNTTANSFWLWIGFGLGAMVLVVGILSAVLVVLTRKDRRERALRAMEEQREIERKRERKVEKSRERERRRSEAAALSAEMGSGSKPRTKSKMTSKAKSKKPKTKTKPKVKKKKSKSHPSASSSKSSAKAPVVDKKSIISSYQGAPESRSRIIIPDILKTPLRENAAASRPLNRPIDEKEYVYCEPPRQNLDQPLIAS